MSDTATSNVQIVRSGYEAFGRGDMAALSELFAEDAMWTHRNGGRFAGPKNGFDAITAFFGESVQLSAGTLRVEPTDLLGDENRASQGRRERRYWLKYRRDRGRREATVRRRSPTSPAIHATSGRPGARELGIPHLRSTERSMVPTGPAS